MSTSKLEQLFAAAREDAPPDAVREAVWERIAAATSAPAATTPATKALGGKLVTFVAVIGTAGAASITALVMSSSPADLSAKTSSTRDTPSVVATESVRAPSTDSPSRPRSEPPPSSATASEALLATPAVVVAATDASSLAEEARLLTEARLALVRGAPERALALARAARSLPDRVLEAEALELEARALRALGRVDEALAIEAASKGRQPSRTR